MGAGVASEAWSKHLRVIETTLMDIEKLHQQYLGAGTMTARDQFYAKRTALFMRLDEQLGKLAAFGSGVRNQGSIKRALGISTKRYLHTGQIAGYANKVAGVSKAAELVKKGGYIGIALDIASTGLEIYKACTLGREEECHKAKYVESGALAGGITGTALGSIAGGFVAGAACSIFLGVTTGGPGALACGIIGGATGGIVGGKLVSDRGESMGELLYEKVAQ